MRTQFVDTVVDNATVRARPDLGSLYRTPVFVCSAV
jgi:hypothetical protein